MKTLLKMDIFKTHSSLSEAMVAGMQGGIIMLVWTLLWALSPWPIKAMLVICLCVPLYVYSLRAKVIREEEAVRDDAQFLNSIQ